MNNKNSTNIINEMKSPKTFFGLLISFIALIWVFHDFNFSSFKSILKDIDIIFLVYASILLWISNWFRGLRWSYLFKKEELVSASYLYRAGLIGYFGNNVLPLRMGEILRCHIVSQQYSLSRSYIFGTVIIERLLDTLTLCILAFILLFVYPLSEAIKSYVVLGITISFIIVSLSFLFLLFIPNTQDSSNSVLQFFFNIISGLKSIRKDKTIIIFFLSILIWSIYLFDVYLIQKAFHFALSWSQILTILVLSTLVFAIPSAPGMVGTYHAAVKYIMVDMFLFAPNQGNAFAILIHGYGYILLTILGAYYFIRHNMKSKLINKSYK